MIHSWSTWLGLDLKHAPATSDIVHEAMARIHGLRHLAAGNSVLAEVNRFTAEMHFDVKAVYTHPDLHWEPEASVALDGLPDNIRELVDTGKWPEAWKDYSLKEMVLVMTAYTMCLKQDYKGVVTMMTKAYVATHPKEEVLDQIKRLTLFTSQTVTGVVLGLNISKEQQQAWHASFDPEAGAEPAEIAAQIYALVEPVRTLDTSSPTM